ncbi:hypothetical protein C449_05147 [Halococcus saccharolyticus DSM 5350]|uniref:Uncharacterized protein n=1 Tax=Halococcus saccharolyticus DSM 5350 TaxID=1227455 RepID=M0MMV8_9EURY|nr:hypothetical protein C449_05147 [Halococcus saccharolyticus DSM 5350]
MDCLARDIQTVGNRCDTTWLVKIPTDAYGGWRKEIYPFYVSELRCELAICFDHWIVSYADTTLVVMTSGFGE